MRRAMVDEINQHGRDEMKKLVLVAVLGVWLGLGSQTAYAGVGDWVKNSWSYVTTPVNCLIEAGKGLVNVGVSFVTCVLSNVNRNPATLDKLITLP